MPTYSYQCEACLREFEKEQRISESAIRKCPSCGKLKLRRLISSSGNFILKGGGWYSDGYGSKSSKATSTGGVDKGSDSKGKSSESSTKDSKSSSDSGTPDRAAAS
jgi:putative FmdB family regulatory protein